MKTKNFNFVFLLFCFICFFALKSSGQLIVDAGNDTIVCSGYNYDENEQIKIGGNPTATGGIAPYTYTWSGARKLAPHSKYMIYASDILDDTTKCNPSFNRYTAPSDWFTFHLKVEDAANHIGYDSVRIRSSRFIISLVGPPYVDINIGDSVQLIGNPYIEGNLPLLKYIISPSYGLFDSTDVSGWAKPERNILYYLQAVDSVGCKCRPVPYLDIQVDTTTASNDVLTNLKMRCFFNGGDLIINQPQKQSTTYQVTITAIDGSVIHSGNYSDRNLRITNLKLTEYQIYVVTIVDGNINKVVKLLNY